MDACAAFSPNPHPAGVDANQSAASSGFPRDGASPARNESTHGAFVVPCSVVQLCVTCRTKRRSAMRRELGGAT